MEAATADGIEVKRRVPSATGDKKEELAAQRRMLSCKSICRHSESRPNLEAGRVRVSQVSKPCASPGRKPI